MKTRSMRTKPDIRRPAGVLPLSHAMVFSLLNVSIGLETPVLSLMLLARGATFATLPLVMGITLVVTAVCEVPSGVAADMLGRRRLFCWAMALQVVAHLVLLLPPGIAVVAVSSALRGLALAARTGTLEAIELDRVVADHSDARERCAALDILNGRLALLESGGVGIGALAGGLLASLDASYALLICAVVGATACVLVGAAILFPRDARHIGKRSSIAATFADMRATLAAPGDVRLVLVNSASAGIVMLAVETYWQLAFQQLAGVGCEWMLGPLNCAGMIAAALGSSAAMRWGASLSQALGRQGRRMLYGLVHAAAAICLLLFAFATNVWLFAAVYLLYYVCIAARSVIEQTALHNAVPSEERAGMASVQSLALRGGGALASATGGWVVAAFGVAGVWPLYAAASLALELVAFASDARAARTG